MKIVLRSGLAIFLGLFAGFCLVFGVEMISFLAIKLPAGLESTDPKVQLAAIGQLPMAAFLMLLLAWTLGTFGASWVAARVTMRRPRIHAAIVASVFLLAGIANMAMMPHPVWFQAASVVLIPVCAAIGALLGERRSVPAKSVVAEVVE